MWGGSQLTHKRLQLCQLLFHPFFDEKILLAAAVLQYDLQILTF